MLYASVLDRLTEGRTLPKGYGRWALKTVGPAGHTRGDYRWPLTPKVVKASGPFLDHDGACPQADGDGICVGLTYAGMASGGRPAITLLLVAYRDADVLGADSDKLRLRACRVEEVLDGTRVLHENGAGAYLAGANLAGAYLAGANLAGAYLTRAYLDGAYLAGAYLTRAYLAGAYLAGAYLTRANLAGANLAGANLAGANLDGAYLAGAYLAGANLAGAYLTRAYLTGANLAGANLDGANLDGATGYKSAGGFA